MYIFVIKEKKYIFQLWRYIHVNLKVDFLGNICDGSNADVSVDQYHRYKVSSSTFYYLFPIKVNSYLKV